MPKVKIEVEVEVPVLLVQVCIERYSPHHVIPNLAFQLCIAEKVEKALLAELLKEPWVERLWEEKMAESARLRREWEARHSTAPESG